MDVNPYQPPVSSYEAPVDPGTQLLASRGSRFGAALIDAIAAIAVNGVLLWATGLFEKMARNPDDLGLVLTTSAMGFGVWLVIQIAFLRSGQTLGKRVVGIRMVDYQTGEVAPAGRLIFLRYLPISVVSAIPLVGNILPLVDVLFIFGAEQRCVHDLIAGTKVVQA